MLANWFVTRTEAEKRKMLYVKECAMREAEAMRKSQKAQRQVDKMYQKLARLEELKEENKRLRRETYELYKKYHDKNPPC